MDPALVAAIIEVESHFDPHAVSRVGAVGLMQIMPSTGEWIADRLGVEPYVEDDLCDPAVNLRFGCYYLSYLASTFDDLWQIIAAYNAGEGVVMGWNARGVTVETIPYPETARYVRRVTDAIPRYRSKKFRSFD